jgi:hypothetical protein
MDPAPGSAVTVIRFHAGTMFVMLQRVVLNQSEAVQGASGLA